MQSAPAIRLGGPREPITQVSGRAVALPSFPTEMRDHDGEPFFPNRTSGQPE
jgi:hypothetical protein